MKGKERAKLWEVRSMFVGCVEKGGHGRWEEVQEGASLVWKPREKGPQK